MSKRFTAEIDWEDSGWQKGNHSFTHRTIGPFTLYISRVYTVWIELSDESVYSKLGFKNITSSKRGCERALRGLLK